jgi:N-acetylmuramoyl-L-alanine amidase
MPAVLIEAGFLSHPIEGRNILDSGYRRQLAGAIVDGLAAYKSLMERRL